MGKGYWHDVVKARDIACKQYCPYNLLEWYEYQRLEFKYKLLEEENEKLKKALKEKGIKYEKD